MRIFASERVVRHDAEARHAAGRGDRAPLGDQGDRERPAQGRGAQLRHPQATAGIRRRRQRPAQGHLPPAPRADGRRRRLRDRRRHARRRPQRPDRRLHPAARAWRSSGDLPGCPRPWPTPSAGTGRFSNGSTRTTTCTRRPCAGASTTLVAAATPSASRRSGPDVMRQVEKAVMLQTLDTQWKDHLAAMDYLRQGIHLRGYAQKNPKQEYKREAFEMFSAMLDSIKQEVVDTLARAAGPDPGGGRRPRPGAAAGAGVPVQARGVPRLRRRPRGRRSAPRLARRDRAGAPRALRARRSARSAATSPAPAAPARSTSSATAQGRPEVTDRTMTECSRTMTCTFHPVARHPSGRRPPPASATRTATTWCSSSCAEGSHLRRGLHPQRLLRRPGDGRPAPSGRGAPRASCWSIPATPTPAPASAAWRMPLASCEALAELAGCAARGGPALLHRRHRRTPAGGPHRRRPARRPRPASTADGWPQAARAIMTTDTVPKLVSRRFTIGGAHGHPDRDRQGRRDDLPGHGHHARLPGHRCGGGAGDPAPACLQAAADRSFNAITVDGDTSTNDACVLAATGDPRQSGHRRRRGPQTTQALPGGHRAVCMELATAIMRDGEGATKLVTIRIEGAADHAEARRVGLHHRPLPAGQDRALRLRPQLGPHPRRRGPRRGRRISTSTGVRIWLGRRAHRRATAGAPPTYTEEAGRRRHGRAGDPHPRRPRARRGRDPGPDLRPLLRLRPHQRRVPELTGSAPWQPVRSMWRPAPSRTVGAGSWSPAAPRTSTRAGSGSSRAASWSPAKPPPTASNGSSGRSWASGSGPPAPDPRPPRLWRPPHPAGRPPRHRLRRRARRARGPAPGLAGAGGHGPRGLPRRGSAHHHGAAPAPALSHHRAGPRRPRRLSRPPRLPRCGAACAWCNFAPPGFRPRTMPGSPRPPLPCVTRPGPGSSSMPTRILPATSRPTVCT